MPPDEMIQQDYQDPDSGEKTTLHLHAEASSDLAVLQITGMGFQPLPFADPPANASTNPKLVLCSYPFGISQTPSAPRLLSVQVALQGNALTMDHKADPGESGAPLLNADGKVVALATSGNQCIPIEAARKLIP
jgi:S1-C subfamily serine protease